LFKARVAMEALKGEQTMPNWEAGLKFNSPANGFTNSMEALSRGMINSSATGNSRAVP
jgi:hypothetical protein